MSDLTVFFSGFFKVARVFVNLNSSVHDLHDDPCCCCFCCSSSLILFRMIIFISPSAPHAYIYLIIGTHSDLNFNLNDGV